MQRSSDVALRRFANAFRRAYETVIAELGTAGGVALRTVRTDSSLPRNTARLKAALELRNGH
jgi:hypothetical protein